MFDGLQIQWRRPLSEYAYFQTSTYWFGLVWDLFTNGDHTIEPWVASGAPITIHISSLRGLRVSIESWGRLDADDMKELRMSLNSWRTLFKWNVIKVDGREQYVCS